MAEAPWLTPFADGLQYSSQNACKISDLQSEIFNQQDKEYDVVISKMLVVCLVLIQFKVYLATKAESSRRLGWPSPCSKAQVP